MDHLSSESAQAIEQAASGICHIGLDGRWLFINHRLCEILGYTQQELSALTIRDVIFADGVKIDLEVIHQLLIGNISQYALEKRCLRKNGTAVWVKLDISLMRQPSVELEHFVFTIHDISDRKRTEDERQQAEDALRQSEERFRSLMHACAQIIWITNADGELVTEQPSWGAFTGQPFEAYQGCGWLSAIHPEDSAHVASVWSSAVDSRSLYEVEFRLRRHDGEYRYMNCRAVPILRPDGTIREWIGANTDITERKQTETALRENEARLRQFIEYAPISIVMFDREMRYLAASSQWLEEYRLTRDILGRSHYDVFPEISQEWKHVHQRCLAGALEQCERDTFVDADGSLEYIRWSIHPWYLASGGVGGLIMFSENITERVQSEIAVKRSEERFRSLVQATAQIIWDTPATGEFVAEQPGWSAFTGQPFEELRGWGWLEAVHPDDRVHTATVWSAALKSCCLYEIEHRLRRSDGEYRYMNVRAVPITDTSGSVVEWIGVHTDISDRKRAEIIQRQSEERLQAILDNSPAVFYMKDLEGRLVLVNRQFETLLGLDRSEFLGKQGQDLFPADVAHTHKINDQAVLAANRAMQWEELVPQDDGLHTYLSLKFPLTGEDGQPYALCGISTDITDRKQAELALAQAKEAAEIASQAKSEFLANMSHELRTPLNGIMGYAQILQRSKSLEGEDRARIDVIYQCASHLLTLINDILDLSKIEAQKVELRPTDFHFPAFLQGVAEMCRIRAELKELTFNYHAASELPLGIHADEKRLRQVLINLLSNATKFTDQGSITFTVSYASEGKIRFEVRDTGIGIPSEYLGAIFQPFEQAGDTRRQTEGTGLGLAISQNIVSLMDSTIQVQSEVGVGSIFWFDVSLPEAEEWVKTSQADLHGQIIGVKDRHPKVLVVDDKWANRSVVSNLLSPLGFDVVEAVDGQDGWAKLPDVQPDLVITDLLMPELDGFGLIKRIRESNDFKDIVIIVSSASVFEADQHRSIEAGGNAFLPKPIQAFELLQKLQTHLQLEWIYEDQDTSLALDATAGVVISPPETEIAVLHALTMKGNFKGIMKHAAYLESLDSKYRPFAQKLNQLAKDFQDERILAFIQTSNASH